MPRPSTARDFVELLTKSELVSVPEIRQYLERLLSRGFSPVSAIDLAQTMVYDKLLTNYQARYLLLGKWRNFVIKGKFKVLDRLGSGGESTVILCEHQQMGRQVALKILSAKITDPASVQRFRHQAKLIAQLDHPNIIRVFDIDSDGGLHFMVMEFVEGVNLHSLVQLRGRFAVARAVNYTIQALQGLQHAHEAGLVHRDLKPANLLLDRSGVVKLTDFGLARSQSPISAEETPKEQAGTSIMGTIDYLAPEQALAPDRTDIRSDLYSLGATLRFLLLGEPLFPNAGLASKIIMHQTVVPTPASQLRADVPEGVSRVIDWMLKKDPRERPVMPAAVVDELMPWYEPVPPLEMNVSVLLQEQNEAAASDDTRMRKNFATDHGTVGGKKGDRRENRSGTTPAP